MASKIFTTELKVGMFVADLDRPWVDTPFLLQGFLIENDEQILALRTHCEYVIVDRARSLGDQFASTMLGWFGASDGQLDKILPNLVHFGAKRSLGFL